LSRVGSGGRRRWLPDMAGEVCTYIQECSGFFLVVRRGGSAKVDDLSRGLDPVCSKVVFHQFNGLGSDLDT
jgi:hypothetical protein